mgnify:CR=1 FL=1
MLTETELTYIEETEAAVASGKTVCANCAFCTVPDEGVPDPKHRPEDTTVAYLCTRRAPDHIFETRSGAHCNFWKAHLSSSKPCIRKEAT